MCRNSHLLSISLNFAHFRNQMRIMLKVWSFTTMAHSQGFTSAVEVDSESIETVWILNAKVKVWSIVAKMNEFSNVFAMMKYKPKGQTGSSGGQNVGDNEKIKQPALSHVQALGVGPSHKSCLSQHIATLFTQVSDKLTEKLLPSKNTNSNYALWYL